jgi:hypothetical protein
LIARWRGLHVSHNRLTARTNVDVADRNRLLISPSPTIQSAYQFSRNSHPLQAMA